MRPYDVLKGGLVLLVVFMHVAPVVETDGVVSLPRGVLLLTVPFFYHFPGHFLYNLVGVAIIDQGLRSIFDFLMCGCPR